MAPSPRRVVVVTGAAQGIGRTLAARFLGEDCSVVGLDVNEERLGEAAGALASDGDFRGIVADVADRASVDAAFARIADDHGRVAVLVNNAAIVAAQPVAEISRETWERVLGVNLTGTFNCVQAALPLFADGGRIVNLSSHSGSMGSRNRAAYAASKGGVNGLTRVLAMELADRGITVNAVAPGPVDTPHARATHSEDRRRAWTERLAIKRYATEDEVAAAVMFLASPAAAYITGHILPVDGGMTAAGLIAAG